MTPVPRQGWLFLNEFLKWYFSKYWQVRTRQVFAQTVTFYLCNSLTTSIPYKVKIVNHIITSCMVNKCVGETYC